MQQEIKCTVNTSRCHIRGRALTPKGIFKPPRLWSGSFKHVQLSDCSFGSERLNDEPSQVQPSHAHAFISHSLSNPHMDVDGCGVYYEAPLHRNAWQWCLEMHARTYLWSLSSWVSWQSGDSEFTLRTRKGKYVYSRTDNPDSSVLELERCNTQQLINGSLSVLLFVLSE